jgi:tRNA pseudouridine55 synthase
VTRNQQPETSGQLDGIIVVNKPADITSARVVAFVKRTMNAKKVGHTGTLDPFAEGVLICCVNKATRLARFLLRGNKTYDAVLKLGQETDTQDATGSVIAVGNPDKLTHTTIKSEFNRFKGTIEQLPPVYSALKHKGVPLYKLARRGRPIHKPARRVHIIAIRIREISIPFIRFEVSCSAGTYIRTLCADIGRSLACGGHLYALKRTQSSGFKLQQALTLSQVEQFALAGTLSRKIIPMTDALGQMPGIHADAALEKKIRSGHRLTLTDVNLNRTPDPNSALPVFVKIVDHGNNLIAVIEYNHATSRFDYCCVLTG